MGCLRVMIFVCGVFSLYIGSTQASTMTMATTTPAAGGGGGGTTAMMEDWKIIAIVVPCVIGGLALLFCLICCCCCQGGGGMQCCDPNYGCGPMCDPNCCGPMCDCNACCGPMCDPAMCCGPQCCGPMCDCNACCGPMCDPGMCCGPQCCGPCCYVQPVTTAPVVTQYATRGQIWPQQACNYRCAPPGAVGGSAQCVSSVPVSSVPVNGGVYGRSLDAAYSGGPAQCGPCQQNRGYRY